MAQSLLSMHLVVERQNVIGGYFESQQTAIPFGFRDNPNQAVELIREFLQSQINAGMTNRQKSFLNLPPDTDWNDIAIALDEETADIWYQNTILAKNITYKEMGFYDLKRKKPNIRWEYLLKLAKHSCLTPPENDQSGKFKKQISELRHDLRGFFKIGENPFYPYEMGGFYAPRFKIRMKKKPQNIIKDIEIEAS
jgi:hypothetical protein